MREVLVSATHFRCCALRTVERPAAPRFELAFGEVGLVSELDCLLSLRWGHRSWRFVLADAA